MTLLYWCHVSGPGRCNSSRVSLCRLSSLFSQYIALHALYIKHTHGFSFRFGLRSLTPLFKGRGPVPLLSSSGAAEIDVWTQWAVKSVLSLSLSLSLSLAAPDHLTSHRRILQAVHSITIYLPLDIHMSCCNDKFTTRWQAIIQALPVWCASGKLSIFLVVLFFFQFLPSLSRLHCFCLSLFQ